MQNTYVKKPNTNQGFTIVELLIVIVVVAILAAISIATYTNINNRAYDSAIQSDLNQMSKTVKLFNAEHGRYPVYSEFISGLGFKISKTAYDTSVYNFYYCYAKDGNQFGIAIRSKSKQTFTISSTGGIAKSGPSPSWQTACGAFGESVLANIDFGYAYALDTGLWSSKLSD